MRRQLLSQNSSCCSNEPQIIVEESTLGDEEAERKRNESPPRCLDPDSPSLNPYLLSPWREARKHSLPTPQCTSGITASQVRRLSERGGEGSGPSPREAAFLATLSQVSGPQSSGGRRHSVVTISKVPPSLFGRNRRESIAAFPMGGASRILPKRRDSNSSGITGPPSNSGSTHNLQLDIMDDIAEIKARKVRLKMWKNESREQICEVQPLDGGNTTSQRYIQQQQQRRFSEFIPPTNESSFRRRASDISRPFIKSPGIVCTNNDLISILNTLTSSATEINRCCDDTQLRDEQNKIDGGGKSGVAIGVKTLEQKRRRLKNFRSKSFDVSILHGLGTKQLLNESINKMNSNEPGASSWFINRHQPIKQKTVDNNSSSSKTTDKILKTVKETLVKTTSLPKESMRHKVVWDDTSGTKVDAQILGSAIEEFLTLQKAVPEDFAAAAGSRSSIGGGDGNNSNIATTITTSTSKNSITPGKQKSNRWFGGNNSSSSSNGNSKEESSNEACESSICSSLKDLFVK